MRRFWRPLFSILPTSRRPISPVERTWVPPQGCRSTPAMSSSRTRPPPDGGFTDEGVSIHVFDAADGWEYLRFDVFDGEPPSPDDPLLGLVERVAALLNGQLARVIGSERNR